MSTAAARRVELILPIFPPTPQTVRYYDDFSDTYNEIPQANTSDQWSLAFDGRRATLDFLKFDPTIRELIRSWCAVSLAVLAPCSVVLYFGTLTRIPTDRTLGIATSTPQTIRSLWKDLHSADLAVEAFSALSNLLQYCCECEIGQWGSQWVDLIAQLPLPRVDKYIAVRTGDAFLRIDEERIIIDYLDQLASTVLTGLSSVDDDLLRSAAILLCSYQFGLRAKQLAMLRMKDSRIWRDGLDSNPAIHLSFAMIKQRSNRTFPLVRKVKRDWCPIMNELLSRATRNGAGAADHVLADSPQEVTSRLKSITELLLGEARGVMELRHTAAQRLVDAGASEEELAAYLGHSDLNTGLIYFRSSPSQAERVNRALGVSAVYKDVAKIARDRFITEADLIQLKGDQQIAGVPHGIPIAGIGGCSSGQPTCPYNPVLSCYGCNRFMPVADVNVHKQVFQDLRGVVATFFAASRGERGSPAFQMESTIAKVKAVIDELGAEAHELLL